MSASSYTVAKSLTWVLAWVLEEVSYFSITGIFFLWKRGFSTGTKCMETISLRQANKRPLLLKDKYSMSATKLQRQQRGQNVLIFFFLGQDRSVVEPQAAEFMDLLDQFYETFTKVLNAQSSPSNKKQTWRALSIIRYSSFFLPSISASLKRLTYFFVSSFLPLLFASICLSLSSCFRLACVAAVVGTCLCFLSTSGVQMNCMLRSWSTRPLARSWTMPSMTWHLCRDMFRSFSLSAVPLNVHLLWSYVPLLILLCKT